MNTQEFAAQYGRKHFDSNLVYQFVADADLSDDAKIMLESEVYKAKKKIDRHTLEKKPHIMKQRLANKKYYWHERSSVILRKVFGRNYKKTEQELIDKGYLLINNQYKCGKLSKYRYCKKIRLADLTVLNDQEKMKRVKYCFGKVALKRKERLIKLLTEDRLTNHLNRFPGLFKTLEFELEVAEQNKELWSGDFRVSLASNGRIYSPLKSMKKDDRARITYNGKRFVEIDLVSCHYQQVCEMFNFEFKDFVGDCVRELNIPKKKIKVWALQWLYDYSDCIRNDFSNWLKEKHYEIWNTIRTEKKYHKSGFGKLLSTGEIVDMNMCHELLDNNGIKSLNVYDAMFVQEHESQIAKELIEEHTDIVVSIDSNIFKEKEQQPNTHVCGALFYNKLEEEETEIKNNKEDDKMDIERYPEIKKEELEEFLILSNEEKQYLERIRRKEIEEKFADW